VGVGTALTIVVLLGSMVWTFAVMAAISRPPAAAAKPDFTVEVEGRQWWWRVRYVSPDLQRSFETANEIHIPAGRPVHFRLIAADVIHSFWIPALGGKTDLIPGQSNEAWLEADRPGTYRGQCAEFCGLQHAHMIPLVIADPPETFTAWWDAQLAPDETPPDLTDGEGIFRRRCGACHGVRGTLAGGALGPDLTHLMARGTLASGTLPNNPGTLAGWIANPQTFKPGAQMPNLDLSGPELARITAYLASLH
jgi:cytochrome c oxidase subunit 2